MKPSTALFLALAAVGSGVLFLAYNPYRPLPVSPGEPVVLEERPLENRFAFREIVQLPGHPCDTILWFSYPGQTLTGERLLCGVLPPSVWKTILQQRGVPLNDLRIEPEGWRAASGSFSIPTSSPPPFYVRVFWIVAFVLLLLGIRHRFARFAHREALGWALVWGGLSVLNRVQMLPGLQGLGYVERRVPQEYLELFFHGPYGAVLLLELLVLWLGMGWILERLRRSQFSIVQDLLLVFRPLPPRWVGGGIWLGAGFALLWFLPWFAVLHTMADAVRIFPDPFLLAGWVPGVHLFHRAFEMAFLLTGLWLALLSLPFPRWMVWGFLALLGAGPLFFPPAGWGALPFLFRLGAGAYSALVFGLILVRYGALVALAFALFAWMLPGSLLLAAQGGWCVLHVMGAWGIPLILGGIWAAWGEDRILQVVTPRLREEELRTLLEDLSPETFREFLKEKGWEERPVWWKLALLAEEIYGIPVEFQTRRDAVLVRIPFIRMVQEGIRMMLGVQGRLEDGWLVYSFPLKETDG